jgi:hypothetical protein
MGTIIRKIQDLGIQVEHIQEVVMIVEAAIVVVLVAPAGRWTTQCNFGVAQEKGRFLGVVVTVYEI